MDQTAAASTAGEETTRPALFAAGGVLGALVSSSCCVLPLALFSLGAGGAWIGQLAALAPYQPIFLAVTLGFLGAGFWRVYRKPQAVCIRPASQRGVRIALWSAAALAVIAAAFPYVAPPLLGI
jgi:mercuric ion transport protein